MIPGIRVESAVEKSAAPTRRRVLLIRHLHFRRDETGTQYACRGAAENVRRHCSDWFRSSSFYMARASIVMVACMRSYSSSLARFWLAAFLCATTSCILIAMRFRVYCSRFAFGFIFLRAPTACIAKTARKQVYSSRILLGSQFRQRRCCLHCKCGACATIFETSCFWLSVFLR